MSKDNFKIYRTKLSAKRAATALQTLNTPVEFVRDKNSGETKIVRLAPQVSVEICDANDTVLYKMEYPGFVGDIIECEPNAEVEEEQDVIEG